MSRAFVQTLSLVLGALVCVGVTENLRAQGAGRHVPSPADSRTLTRLLERYVSPTVPQWLEIERAHEAYLARFARLRDEDIARLLEFASTSMSGVPDERTAREYLRRRSLVDRKVEEEDARLIDEIAGLLEEEQLPGLERFRRARERVRLDVGLSAPGAPLVRDLWSVIDMYERDLGPEPMALIDAEMSSYEERLGAALREWNKAQASMFLILIEELQQQGLGGLTAGDTSPDQMRQTAELFQQALEKGQKECSEAAARVRKLNDRTIRTIESLLGEEYGRRLRMAYIERNCNTLIGRDPGRIERMIHRLLESELLDEAIRDAVRELRQTYRTADDRQVERMVKYLADRDVLMQPLGMYDTAVDDANPILQQLTELGEALEAAGRNRGELVERTREQLRSLVENVASGELVAIIDSGGRARDEQEELEFSESLETSVMERGGPTDLIPERISRRDLERIRRRLEPEPWQQAILSTIHDDYIDTWRREVAPLAAQSSRAQSTVYSLEPKTHKRIGDPEKLQAAYEHARLASNRAGEIDRAFFDDLNASLDENQQGALLRARLARELDRYLRGTDPIFSPSGVAFKPGNVIQTIDEVDLTAEERLRIDAFLQERSEELLELARATRDVRAKSEQRIHELNMRMSAGMTDGTMTSTDHGIAYRKLSDEMVSTHGDVIAEWRLSHDAFVEELQGLLDTENARDFNRAWKRNSNPYVYRDPNAATIPVEAALGLSDITSEQIGAISEVLADYDEEWERLSSKMADVHIQLKQFGALTPPEEYSRWSRLREDYAALSFQRDEASMRTLRRLARYLEPEQRDRIRALRQLEY